jgi:tRNA-2-methylthio-N6-dimethylallyladenosine synthase
LIVLIGFSQMPFVYFETFGCQMNVADSDMLAQTLFSQGYLPVDESATADLIVVNTCSVRQRAEIRAQARIHEYCVSKEKNRGDQKIWVIGCMAQRLGKALQEKMPGINRVIGAKDIVSFVQELSHTSTEPNGPLSENSPKGRISAFVPIMRGCNNYCAYCVVPYVRGAEMSIPAHEIEESIKRLSDCGTKEVVLLGQNVNSYNYDGLDFPKLLEKIHDIAGIKRIRFTTSHPKDCTESLLRGLATLPKLCKHIHLPVQAGSTRILHAMNRGYDRAKYLEQINALRLAVPGIDITTDAMVGFPSETKRDFDDTISLFKEARFTTAFMFAYSKRENTSAAAMNDDVPMEEKKERLSELITLQTTITKEHYNAMVGRNIEVLLTERQRGKEGLWMGQDYGCKRTLLACSETIAGMILPIRVIRSTGMTLVGERVKAL